MKCLGAIRGAHTIHLHHDESELSQRLHADLRAEGLRHEGSLRPGIDVFNDRILFRRIEVCRPYDYAPDIGLAIPRQ
jgi:hypothetical protein